ncbi:hypothetical protein INS49_004647 [Diaporthe citri]|uniref:uncharacterized protein n=1 Tax=Diaporthe citri TaxID=83186 RepID=UPI001C7F216A|nr:uncharacterized protein INS49_004647 [Diaporthe citri]KAG6354629.1 hypothetical protein INS49_004647 [Diaporthe citri]
MSQPKTPNIKKVTLDDADLEKRNEALIIENEIIKEEILDIKQSQKDLADRVAVLYGVQTIGVLRPEQVRALYAAIEAAIEAFVGPMDKFIRENSDHKNRVEGAMSREGSAKAFRSAISDNAELQAAAVDPDTCVIDVWTAYIWRFLVQNVFSDEASIEFYSGEGQNATYYIKNLIEMDYLMTQAKPPVFGLYSRRLWHRQALSAIFRTADFDWVQSHRTAKIEELSQDLRRAFQVFARPFPEDRALELIRAIFAAAVRLNEHIMTEADDIWTLELDGVTGSEDDFYDNLEDFDLKPVGTLEALGHSAPLDNIKTRFSMDEIKKRLTKLCVMTPALRYQHIQPTGEEYGEHVHVVKPQVLVALEEVPGSEEVISEHVLPDELMFYKMAESLGLVQEPLERQ